MADAPKEKWLGGVAMTTVVLAVCAALSTLKGGSFSTRTQLETTKENNAWSYFQSKSIKQHACEVEADILEVSRADTQRPDARALIDSKLSKVRADIARYDREKTEIQTDAKKRAIWQNDYKRHAASMGMAAMLLQIAIMLSSISALMKRKPLWFAGLVCGSVGILYLLNGFLDWF